MKPRPGKLYRFEANGWDRIYPHARTPEDGAIVRAIKSPWNAEIWDKGYCYVATPEGKFIGLVSLGSLQPLGVTRIMGTVEHQQPNFGCRTEWPSRYRFVGEADGLYAFTEDDGATVDLFAKRDDPPAGWWLEHNGEAFEFCRSIGFVPMGKE